MTGDDHGAITDLLTAVREAWNAGDADAYGVPFTDDATYINFMGGVDRGRTAIVETHRWVFANIPGSQMNRGHADIRFPGPDVAVVLIDGGGTTISGPGPDPDRASAISLVAVRTGEGWRFTHFQNTRITAPPAR